MSVQMCATVRRGGEERDVTNVRTFLHCDVSKLSAVTGVTGVTVPHWRPVETSEVQANRRKKEAEGVTSGTRLDEGRTIGNS